MSHTKMQTEFHLIIPEFKKYKNSNIGILGAMCGFLNSFRGLTKMTQIEPLASDTDDCPKFYDISVTSKSTFSPFQSTRS